MPLPGEPLPEDLSSDPTALSRWSYNYLSGPLPDDDPTQPFCARHASTVAHLTRDSFGPHPFGGELISPLPDWGFGSQDEVLERRSWCRVCALISDAMDKTSYSDQAEVIACWVWDGLLSRQETAGKDMMATLRLRIAPAMSRWNEAFEPFDLIPLVGEPKSDLDLFMGRPVPTDHFDMGLVRGWIENCAKWHGSDCVDTMAWKPSDRHVPFIRLISLAEDRLIESASPPPYAALSYVWGSAPVFKALKNNISELMKPGSLSSQQFPKSIRDAISLARALHFDFLWVDSICIIQDSDTDKDQQIRIMDAIYSRANLTIVAAAGADANAGIPGIDASSRSRPQHVAQISDDLTLVALHPDSHCSVTETTWNTRGWTYQERLLSRRCLFSFPDGSVSFQCAKAVWGEDYRAETPQLMRCASMMDISLNRSWMEPGSVRERGPPTVRIKKTSYLHEYSRLVEEYTIRNMTYATDRLLGINGVLDVLRSGLGLRFVQGLPEPIIHMALLWQPVYKLRRVPENKKTGLPLFPSWSWAGWIGPVAYENWNEFNSLPDMEERARRVVPFSKIYIAGSIQLQAFSASSNEELPTGWSRVTTASDGVCFVFGKDSERYHSVPLMSPQSNSPVLASVSQQIGLTMRTRIASFRLTFRHQSSDLYEKLGTSTAFKREYRFGLSMPSPATTDNLWLGTILLAPQYWNKVGRDYEFIVLSESYGFNNREMEPARAGRLHPFAVYDVMMIRRVVGQELEKYRTHFIANNTMGSDWWSGKPVVERVGVGRMLKTAWEGNDVWDDFILV